MNRNKIFDKIVATIKSVDPECCSDFSKINESTNLVKDLGFDSMGYLLLCSSLEEAFNVKPVEDKTVYKFITVGDVVDYVISKDLAD